MSAPLAGFTSVKLKLGAVVAGSVLVAAVLGTLSDRAAIAPWLGIPVTVMLALGVTQLLATGMTSPLREMTAAARRMATGDYDVRVRAVGADEVGELGRAFNQMATDLRLVDRQRRELVATVSHELRTPLTGLIGVLENLEDGVTEPDPAGLRVALDQAERLSGLVRDLLDLSRLEAGGVSLQVTDVRVGDLVDAAIDETRALGRPVELVVDVPPDLVVDGDRARLQQLLANLLDNASRHSPAGGRVSVEVAAVADDWRLAVTNDGPPMPADTRTLLTRRSGFLSGLENDPATGATGLGLAIVAWAAELHGGRVDVVDTDGQVRVEAVLPLRARPGPDPAPSSPPSGAPMTTTSPTPLPPPSEPFTDLLSRWTWRPDLPAARPDLLIGSAIVGLLGAVLVADQLPGIGWVAVLLAGSAVVYRANREHADWFTRTCAALAVASVLMLAVRDALWIGVLCTLSAAVLCVAGSTRFRSATGFVASGILWPISAVHGIPWLGRTLESLSRGRARTVQIARTVGIALIAVIAFGLLFASADAVFGSWVGAIVPDPDDSVVFRVFVGIALGGVVLATSYFALNPPDVESLNGTPRRVTRFEWLFPVLVVDAVFVLFLIAQAPALLGNDAYIQRTTGLTYAEYTHQGFGQLTVAAALSFAVIALASRKASLAQPSDRRWFRISLGILGISTLVVVASALHRIGLYQDAYGYSQLRVLVVTFEVWLGVVMVAVLAAGLWLKGAWLARFALLSGSAALLVLALANPDAIVAEHNIDRFAAGHELDLAYLAELSGDAVPAISTLPAAERDCVASLNALPGDHDWFEDRAWWEYNIGQARGAGERSGFSALDAEESLACPATTRG